MNPTQDTLDLVKGALRSPSDQIAKTIHHQYWQRLTFLPRHPGEGRDPGLKRKSG
jgi:hypothetical protein